MGFMGDDHDRLDGIFKEFQSLKNKEPGRAGRLFHDFKTGLQRHIVWEEEILFPLFENKTGMSDNGPTAVMRMEHVKIKDFLEKIHDKVMKGGMQSDDLEQGLMLVLSEHNNKEENILYPCIDDSVTEEEKAEAFEKIHSLPQGKYGACCKGD